MWCLINQFPKIFLMMSSFQFAKIKKNIFGDSSAPWRLWNWKFSLLWLNNNIGDDNSSQLFSRKSPALERVKWLLHFKLLVCLFWQFTLSITSLYFKFHERTLKKSCPFVIKFGADTDVQALVVKSIADEHNHQLDKVRFL